MNTFTPRPFVIPTETFVALANLAYGGHGAPLWENATKALGVNERNVQRWLAGHVAPPADIVARVVVDAADAHDRLTVMLDTCETNATLSPLIDTVNAQRNHDKIALDYQENGR